MKKATLKMMMVIAMTTPTVAMAHGGMQLPHPILLGTSFVTMAPTMLTGAISDGLKKNDMLMVREDAIVALETGEISTELQSVVNQWRADHKDEKGNDPYFDASDLDVIEIMLVEADQ